MEKIKKQKAFTLVELIIVITILAVLATIAFLSFRTYTMDSRDAQRLTNLSNIEKALSVFYIEKGYYPNPDGNISTGIINGNSIVLKGVFGEKVSQLVGFSNIPLDPLVQTPYSYSILENKREYQAGGMLEKSYASNGIISQTYADNETVKMIGDYKGYLKFASGCTMYANVPSILWNNSGSVNLLDTADAPTTPRYIINKGKNMLFRFTGIQSDVITGSSLPDTVLQDLRQSEQARLISLCEAELKAINASTPEVEKQEVLASFGLPDIEAITEVVLADKPLPGNTQGGSSTPVVTNPFMSSGTFVSNWVVGSGSYGNGDLNVSFGIETAGEITIDWGDGGVQVLPAGDYTPTRVYSTGGLKQITISGPLNRFFNPYGNTTYHGKLVGVTNWDGIVWSTMDSMFYQARNLTSIPSTQPNLDNVTSFYYMFRLASSFNQNINHWDVSNITNMGGTFAGAYVFNQPLNNWDVSNVTNMSQLFAGSMSIKHAFNQNINNWNVSNVVDMNNIFKQSLFNQPLNNWDVSNVTNMSYAFYDNDVFNQDLSSWNVSNVTNFSYMFMDTTLFNQPLNNWDVSNATNLSGMFDSTWNFDQPLNNWNVSNVTNFSRMFYNASKFNKDLNAWNTSSATGMSSMFAGFNSIFNQPLNNWNTSNVIDMASMFSTNDHFNQDISSWNVSNVEKVTQMFYGVNKMNRDLSSWNLNKVLSGNCNTYAFGTTAWVLPKPTLTNCTP